VVSCTIAQLASGLEVRRAPAATDLAQTVLE